MNEKEQITQGLAPLFSEARQKGLWFFSPYQQLWFSPQQLQNQQAKGKFLWGAVNWQLRNPMEMVQQAENDVAKATKHLREVQNMTSGENGHEV